MKQAEPVDGSHEGDHGEDSGDPQADAGRRGATVKVEADLRSSGG
jgi:hypothetical protein